jgi:phenylacetate-coenzyme A ligase PaaK-like adenylate-forming protein
MMVSGVVMGQKKLDAGWLENIRSFICIPYDEYAGLQGRMLSEITADAQRSPVYKGRIFDVDGIEELNELPLTFWRDICASYDSHGIEGSLLQKPHTYWQTSGYTGEPKRFYFSRGDVDFYADSIVASVHLMGVRPWHSVWAFGGGYPMLSGNIMDITSGRMGIEDYVTTPVNNDGDLVKALREISGRGRFDVMAGTPLLYLLISRMVNEPEFYQGLAVDRLKEWYRVPPALGCHVARLYLKLLFRNVNVGNLENIIENVGIGVSFSEPMDHYLYQLRRDYPAMQFHDFLGSTEVPFYGVQFSNEHEALSLLLRNVIPEIARPADVVKAMQGTGHRIDAIPWSRWKKGMRGELIISRPGECLPLLRYPTGDLIEVLDAGKEFSIDVEGEKFDFKLPSIKILGRSVDAVDFEVPDEMGIFLVGKIYSRHINDALFKAGNVKWWELYHVKGAPGRLVFLVIPEKDVTDKVSFRKLLMGRLLAECDELTRALSTAMALKTLDIIITKPEAYVHIQNEIDRRIKQGRALGQLKPRHIFMVEGDGELQELIASKIKE